MASLDLRQGLSSSTKHNLCRVQACSPTHAVVYVCSILCDQTDLPLHYAKSFDSTLPLLEAKVSQCNVVSPTSSSFAINMAHMSWHYPKSQGIVSHHFSLGHVIEEWTHMFHNIGTSRTSIHLGSIKTLNSPLSMSCCLRTPYRIVGIWSKLRHMGLGVIPVLSLKNSFFLRNVVSRKKISQTEKKSHFFNF